MPQYLYISPNNLSYGDILGQECLQNALFETRTDGEQWKKQCFCYKCNC